MWRGELLADPEVYCEVVPTGTSLSGSSYPPPMGGSQHSPPPAVLPHFLADQAGHPRLFLSRRDDPALRRPAGDLEDEFGSDRCTRFGHSRWRRIGDCWSPISPYPHRG